MSSLLGTSVYISKISNSFNTDLQKSVKALNGSIVEYLKLLSTLERGKSLVDISLAAKKVGDHRRKMDTLAWDITAKVATVKLIGLPGN